MQFPYVQSQSQVENKHYSTVSGLIRLVISLECFIEITELHEQYISEPQLLAVFSYSCLDLYTLMFVFYL